MKSPKAERVGRQEETAASSAGRAAPASGGTPARSDRRPAAAAVRAGGEAPTTGAAKSGGHAAATARTSRGARPYGRRQGQGLDGGHPAGWWGGRIGASYADGRHQVMWRGLGNGPREGGPSVAPGYWRDFEPGVVGGRESSDATAAGPTPVQVNGGVGDGLPRVKCGGAVGRRERGGAYHGGRPSAVAA